MTIPRITSFNYVLSQDVTTQLSIKVGGLDGKPPLPPSPHISEDMYRGDFQQTYADLQFSCYIWHEGSILTLPVSTSYRAFSSRWQWNERLSVPIRIRDLPRTAYLICEVREVVSSTEKGVRNTGEKNGVGGTGEKVAKGGGCHGKKVAKGVGFYDEVVVGGAAVPIYTIEGALQCGLVDIKLRMGVWQPEELVHISEQEVGVRDEMTELARLVKQHHSGEIEKVDWLDRLTFREVEHVNERSKQENSSYHLSLEFPPAMCKDLMSSVVHHEEEEPLLTSGNDICTIHDPELLMESLVEQKQHKLSRSLRHGPEVKNLKPNPTTKQNLRTIIDYPTNRSLTSDEQDLIWTYRYYLCRFKKALPKFLKCIDFEDNQEVEVAMELVELWEFIDVEDALGLLSAYFTHSFVRLYAVKRLEAANDDDLRLYLLQLVQALKFENAEDVKKDGISPLGKFLISRACNNSYFGNYFYWYLLVECEDTNQESAQLYKSILKGYSTELKRRGEEGEKQRKVLTKQTNLIKKLRDILGSLGKGTRPQKIEFLKIALKEGGLEDFGDEFPLPLNPQIIINGIIPEKATLFKSSMMPARITFKTADGGEYVTIFKNGDDLRQDQLILQVIELMDKLLCKENLNLKLKPYRALATGPDNGFLQFVDSKAVAQVLQQDGTILNYFMKQSKDGKTVDPEIMDTYIRSCAGYCVITYILGVGDRHLDNLMLTKHGHLLHIDFGYILGKDPKPFPPPMKLSKEMVEVMSGPAEYARFREHCYNAFLILRRSAGLIINLFSLMLRANIPDISVDPEGAVRKVQDKFGLDLSEEEAVQLFQQIIDESIKALFSVLMENVHRWAQYWRR